MRDWKEKPKTAQHWNAMDNGRVECTLCPRHCKIKDEQFGFCKVRGQVDGELKTFIYGKSVAATEEVIETEAVYHHSPGARILSLGNIGCMFSCDFCQNWQTSQVKHLNPSVVQFYSPQQVVDMALKNDIEILSWTYNDPVVWHEFVVDTARLAAKHGIKNLYKSAFYIEEKPVEELIEVMDIFSISLKSMNDEFYRKFAKGRLQPILDRIEQVHRSERHLEVSQLLITERNEGEEDIRKTVNWMVEHLGTEVPLHFVGFHPAYKYLHVDRTPLEALKRAREIALEAGIRYCYLGNVYENGVSDTACNSCDNTLVRRFGLTSEVIGITEDNHCKECGTATPFRSPFAGQKTKVQGTDIDVVRERNYTWDREVKSLHLVAPTDLQTPIHIQIHQSNGSQQYQLGGHGLSRVIVSRTTDVEKDIRITWDRDIELQLMPVLDRAHFPTSEKLEEAR